MIKLEKPNLKNNVYKISLLGFIAMIFPNLYGIANPQQAFYQMGYAAIIYMIVGAILFFIPYSFMVSEMGSAFKDKQGGIFIWMKESMGEKYSLIVTMIWYGSQVLWFVTTATITWVVVSTAIFGKDMTSTWTFLGLNNSQTLAILGVILIVVIALASGFGVKNLTFLSTVALVSMIVIHILIIGGSLIIFASSGFHFSQPMISSFKGVFIGPNPNYSTPLASTGFFVFVVFMYGGMEIIAGLADQVKNPTKNVPKGIIFSTIIITGLMVGIVLLIGMYINWKQVLSRQDVSLGNFSVYEVQAMGIKLGHVFGLNQAASINLGLWLNRILSWSTAIALAVLPLKVYAPIKQLFKGVPKGLLPEKLTRENKNGIPMNAVWLQTIIVSAFLIAIGFSGGSTSTALYNKVVLIMTVAMTVPYFFIVIAYIKFKKNKNIKKSYEFFSVKSGVVWGIITAATLLFANIFSIIQPILEGETNAISNTLWLAAGPIIFAAVGWILYKRYEIKKKRLVNENSDNNNLTA